MHVGSFVAVAMPVLSAGYTVICAKKAEPPPAVASIELRSVLPSQTNWLRFVALPSLCQGLFTDGRADGRHPPEGRSSERLNLGAGAWA